MDHPFATLTSAARAWSALRQATLEANPSRATAEDRASVEQEHQAIESEITSLTHMWEAATTVVELKHPSVEQVLRRRGYRFEANRIADFVQLVIHLQSQK